LGRPDRDTRESRFYRREKCATVLLSHRAETVRRSDADVAQLVERNLAKVEVAGSNPVVRSERVRQASFLIGGVAERFRQRPAKPSTRVRIPSPPRQQIWTIGAAVARFPDTEEVTGSIPVSSTKPIGDSCPRIARTGSPSLFVRRRCARRGAGASPPAPPAPSLRSAAGAGRRGWLTGCGCSSRFC